MSYSKVSKYMYVEVIDMKQDKEQNDKSSCTLKINGIQYNQT